MIREEFANRALWALHDLLVDARAMAFERLPHAEIAAFLDAVEYLLTLIARDEDLTEQFRGALEDIAVRFRFGVALQRFQNEIPK